MSASLAIVAEAPARASTPAASTLVSLQQNCSGGGDSRADNQFAFPSRFPPVTSLMASYVPKWTACAGPAPMITEDTPRHNTRTPSVDDIRVKALPIPVYIAPGEVANTCIRVCNGIPGRMGMSDPTGDPEQRR